MSAGKVLVYDHSSNAWLQSTWFVGAWVFQSQFDASFGVSTVDAVFDSLENFVKLQPKGYKIKELQWWSHGGSGSASIGNESFWLGYMSSNPKYEHFRKLDLFDKDAVWWFRTCSTASLDGGRLFMKTLANDLKVTVAGHLVEIGALQTRLVALRPNTEPWWTDDTAGVNLTFLQHTFPVQSLQGH
jgi:hypothetical protein